MKLFYSFFIILSSVLVSSMNLRNLLSSNRHLVSNDDRFEDYEELTNQANKTFYLLYDIALDFNGRLSLEIDDDTKYLRVIINDNRTSLISENFDSFKYENGQINSALEIPDNITITLFGRTYNLKDEFMNLIHMIFYRSVIDMIEFPKENYDKFDAISKYVLIVHFKDYVGTIDVILEDKDDKVSIYEDLEEFWENVKRDIPEKYIHNTRLAAEFVAVTFGIRRAVSNRRDKLVQIANETFYQLYNISLNFNGRNMIELNEEGKYYKILINEYPKYEGENLTKIKIINSRVFINDFPILNKLTFKIFGREYSLKEEFLSILYLIAPIIKDGVITIEKRNLDNFDSQINYKVELIRENEQSQGGLEITFEDKDDKYEIEKTLNSFWETWSKEIPTENIDDSKVISQFVVTTFGIWHHIQNRYDKIEAAAVESIYQLLNNTIDFKGRYIYVEINNAYELSVLIDEFPLEPEEIGTYINISNGIPYFPNYAETKDKSYKNIKLNISNNLFDVDEEYKAFGSIFASVMRNGKVIIYKKTIETVSNIIRFKCFLYSQNNEEYGAFEISLKYIEKSKWDKVKEGISNFWDDVKKVLTEVNEGVKLVSEIVGNILGIREKIANKDGKKDAGSYLNSNIGIMLLTNLLIIIIL